MNQSPEDIARSVFPLARRPWRVSTIAGGAPTIVDKDGFTVCEVASSIRYSGDHYEIRNLQMAHLIVLAVNGLA